MKKIMFLMLLGITMISTQIKGQGVPSYENGLTIKLGSEGQRSLRFIMLSQMWARYTEMNPGTALAGEPLKSGVDFAIRRTRLVAMANLSDRFMIFLHIGANNQTFTSGGYAGGSAVGGGTGPGKRPTFFVHDAWNEYTIFKPAKDRLFSLTVGLGLHYYLGLSRFTMSGAINSLAIEVPAVSFPTIDASDQFGRQLGMFFKGKVGKLEYRFSVNKQFRTAFSLAGKEVEKLDDKGKPVLNDAGKPVMVTEYPVADNIAVDNNGQGKITTRGYLEYQFFDQESNTLPYKAGSYLGTKRVFNIGVGYQYSPEMTRSLENGTQKRHDYTAFAIDAFYDSPLEIAGKRVALTAYSVYYKYNMGPNYLRNFGVLNYGETDPNFKGQMALAGTGNAQAWIGTGDVFIAEAGLLLPAPSDAVVKWQPYGRYIYKDFQALKTSSGQYDLGLNLLMQGQNAKLTLQYSARPVFYETGKTGGHKGEFMLGALFYL